MYINFIISVGSAVADDISDNLLESGALSVSQESIGESIRLTALFPESVADIVSEEYAVFCPTVELVEDKDWQNEWIEHYEPVIVDGICAIIPAGMEYEAELPRIIIDPRDAFGSGTHPTTILCIRHLYTALRASGNRASSMTLLDIGTGSGILAIAAILFGIGTAEGCDIEEKAVIRAKENVVANGQDAKIRLFTSSIEDLACVNKYDIVCANVQSVIIENNIEKIVSLAKSDGLVIASGIGAQWKSEMTSLFSAHNMTVEAETEMDDWMAYTLSTR